jgi:hypothetical protein
MQVVITVQNHVRSPSSALGTMPAAIGTARDDAGTIGATLRRTLPQSCLTESSMVEFAADFQDGLRNGTQTGR